MNKKGFILWEMVIVLLLVGMIGSLTPGFIKTSDSIRLTNFLELLNQDIAYASLQSSARLENVNVHFNINIYRIRTANQKTLKEVPIDERIKITNVNNGSIQFSRGTFLFITTLLIECGDITVKVTFKEKSGVITVEKQ